MEVRSALAIFGALNSAQAKYLVVGGLAVNAYGYLRFTNDIDLFIALDPENIIATIKTLNGIGFHPKIPVTAEQLADPILRESWRSGKNMLVLQLWSDLHRQTPIDIFVFEPFPFDEAYRRATEFEVAKDFWVPVVPLDRLLQMKTSAGRPQDLHDIEQLKKI